MAMGRYRRWIQPVDATPPLLTQLLVCCIDRLNPPPDGELRAIPSGPLVNSAGQSNFFRSHEHLTRSSTCNRHPNDAAVPARYLTGPG
ncbi:hypothetical protein BC2230_30639 [Burkholderia cepacia]